MLNDPSPFEIAGWDAGELILECLFQRASDGVSLGLHVRTSFGWLLVGNPTEALAGQIQQALADPCAQARAYLVAGQVGIIIRTVRGWGGG
jgi:hypothetical protein